MKPMILANAVLLLLALSGVGSHAETKIAVWNMQAELSESITDRIQDFSEFDTDIAPDVIVLVEVNGEAGTRAVVDALNWPVWHSVTTDLAELSTNVFFALEMAVISKNPILSAIEYDASEDGVHAIRNHTGADKPVQEMRLTTAGIPGFGQPLRHTDRGTIRVDLENGLSIFPVHLKSNRAPTCGDPREALDVINANDFELTNTLRQQLSQAADLGFLSATRQHRSNAEKRERVMAAVVKKAEEAITDGRTVVIAGDFNTAYEPGKKGSAVADCNLQHFACAKAPFPATACSDGDGYDDTLGILDSALVGPTTWKLLTKNLGRTYTDTAFADKAIDHIAVSEDRAENFSSATKAKKPYGSDHFPVIVTFTP